MINRACTKNILDLVDVSRKLLFCADKGDIQRKDERCGVLFGSARDAAYHLIELAQCEKERHIKNGTWDSSIEKSD